MIKEVTQNTISDLTLELCPNTPQEKELFIRLAQTSFQTAYEQRFGKYEKMVLPARDVKESFISANTFPYWVKEQGKIVGGVVVKINPNHHNDLLFLFVNPQVHSKGIGQRIWQAIEKLYPTTLSWDTHTPYFDIRNIHFYVNRLGFKIIEFFNPYHPMPNNPDEPVGGLPEEHGRYFFHFRKEYK